MSGTFETAMRSRASILEADIYEFTANGTPIPPPSLTRVAVDQCKACHISAGHPSRSPWRGHPSSLMFITDQPSHGDREDGRILSGIAGDLLDQMTEAVGFAPYAVSSMLGCRPVAPLDTTPLAPSVLDARAKCAHHLDAALEASGAWLVVAVGKEAALEYKLGDAGVWRWHGSHLYTGIYHPADILKRGGTRSREYETSMRVLRQVHGVLNGYANPSTILPPPMLTSSLDPTANDERIRTTLSGTGYVPIWSRTLDRTVVIYDPKRAPVSSITLPPGVDAPLFFTLAELVALRTPDALRKVIALKEVFPEAVVVS